MTQKEGVLAHLKAGYAITPLEALKYWGCFRLANVIFELKRDGYDIKTTLVENGKKHFASYKLVSSPVKLTQENGQVCFS